MTLGTALFVLVCGVVAYVTAVIVLAVKERRAKARLFAAIRETTPLLREMRDRLPPHEEEGGS